MGRVAAIAGFVLGGLCFARDTSVRFENSVESYQDIRKGFSLYRSIAAEFPAVPTGNGFHLLPLLCRWLCHLVIQQVPDAAVVTDTADVFLLAA